MQKGETFGTLEEDEGGFEGGGGFFRRRPPFTERGGGRETVEKKITKANEEEGGYGGFLIVITFMSPLNLINVAANCQNDDILFNDSKFWHRIPRANFLKYVAANSQN